MKVHELKRGQRFTVPALPELPPATFDHMDGMYCFATTDDGQVVNLKAWTEINTSPAIDAAREGKDG